MAATVVVDHDIPIGKTEHLYSLTIALDNSYPTGGYSIDPSGNSSLDTVVAGNKGGYGFAWSRSTQKLLVYWQKDPANAGGADIPMPEVANGADLSAVTTLHALAIGA